MVSPRVRREQVGFLRERGLSQRRACGLLNVARSMMAYRLRQPEKDAPALAAMNRLSAQYPRSEAHLRAMLAEWVTHYNTGRPHSALGRGVPDPPQRAAGLPKSKFRHRLGAGAFVRVKSVLSGLHHEYSLAPA